MDKDEAVVEFLKGLRIALNNASAYPKGHPYLIKSIENFKQKIDALFIFLNPVKIDITPDSLFIEGRKWEKTALYVELASIFHQRKIKSIELMRGLTVWELIDFLEAVSLPRKEILRHRGVANILNREKNPHIHIEELDYSQFLGTEGEELKDVWAYLFKEAVDKKDAVRINEFADNFENIMGKFEMKDLFEDEETKKSLCGFINYLKDNQKEKFYKCSKLIFKLLSKYKGGFQDKSLDTIRSLFKDFKEGDFAGLLWDELATDDGFDILSLGLFSRITGEEKGREISVSFLSKAEEEGFLQNNPKAIKKIQDLLAVSEEHPSSEVYRRTLSDLLKNFSFDKGAFFDRELLHKNYLFVLLNLLNDEKDKVRLKAVSDRISKELEGITKEKDFQYLKYLLDIVNKRRSEETTLNDVFEGLNRSISNFVERAVWEEGPSADLGYLANALQESSLNSDFYLDKIFREEKINPYGLKLFFRFFPASLPLFYENLGKRYSDMGFLAKIIENVSGLNPLLSGEILKRIFSFANEIIKIEVLKAMRGLAGVDYDFLLSVLQKEKKSASLKKEALAILAREENTRKKVAGALLSVPSPWGRKNKIIIENIRLIEDSGLKEAEAHLAALSKRPFFWNRNVRKRAAEVLKKWHVREY
jgi:hypothetical protein